MKRKAKRILAVRTLLPRRRPGLRTERRAPRHQSKGFRTKAEALEWVKAAHVKGAWIFEGGKTLYRKRKPHHARSR